MNHIHSLTSEKVKLGVQCLALKAGINTLRAYLHSSKFAHGDPLDGYVNTADVLHRLSEIEHDALLAAESAQTDFIAEFITRTKFTGRNKWDATVPRLEVL